jgi:phage anti-repressor protein
VRRGRAGGRGGIAFWFPRGNLLYITKTTTTVVKAMVMPRPKNGRGERRLVQAMIEITATERFATWFERQLQYGFTEGEDFTGVKTFTVVNNGARLEIQDYNLFVDMSKQICILQSLIENRRNSRVSGRRFRYLPTKVEAVQFNENADEISEFCNCEVTYDKEPLPNPQNRLILQEVLTIHLADGERVAKGGDYIIKDRDGKYHICNKNEFKLHYVAK